MNSATHTVNGSRSAKLPGAADVDYAVDIVGLSKHFRRHTISKGAYTTLKSSLLSFFNGGTSKQGNLTRAVDNLTMRIPRGASVGVIGRNGSGKSTLLKLITGIYKPTKGKILLNGKIAALIELGAGFHPDFTGRENLMLGAVLHGLTRAQVRALFDEIVAFAELEDVIDDPVRTYSSGMFMRLGFSLAIHTDPDILIVDEVLSVGDAAFVAKCRERIAELRRKKKTLILVTHDLDAVERWCDEVLWLHAGEVRDRGEPRRVIDHYREFIEHGEEEQMLGQPVTAPQTLSSGAEPQTDLATPSRWGSREAEILAVRLLNDNGNEQRLFHTDDKLCIELSYRLRETLNDVVFGICLTRLDGLVVYGTNTDLEKVSLRLSTQGKVTVKLDRIGLLEGTYLLDAAVHRTDGYAYDYQKSVVRFAVRSPFNAIGVFAPSHRWEVG